MIVVAVGDQRKDDIWQEAFAVTVPVTVSATVATDVAVVDPVTVTVVVIVTVAITRYRYSGGRGLRAMVLRQMLFLREVKRLGTGIRKAT